MGTLQAILALCLCFGANVCLGYHSCQDLKQNNPGASDGTYSMWNGKGQTYEAYCEYRGNHGYMFISKYAGVDIDIAKVNPSSFEVLVRHLGSNGKQYETKLEQITAKQAVPLSIQYNQNTGYNAPVNHAQLGPYLYLGFLPINVAKSKTVQGYHANNKDYTFTNCDANPNSYIAFFFNPKNVQPVGYYKKCCYTPLMRKWIDFGQATRIANYLPSKFFMQFEMHMGGCGGYALNGYNTLKDISGSALGIRFEL